MAIALQKCLQYIQHNLQDPDYNFFIHTARLGPGRRDAHYHWHIEIVPHLSHLGIQGGLELGTGLNINTVDPDLATRILLGREKL